MNALDLARLLGDLPDEMITEADAAFYPGRRIRLHVLYAAAACIAVLIAAVVYPKLRVQRPPVIAEDSLPVTDTATPPAAETTLPDDTTRYAPAVTTATAPGVITDSTVTTATVLTTDSGESTESNTATRTTLTTADTATDTNSPRTSVTVTTATSPDKTTTRSETDPPPVITTALVWQRLVQTTSAPIPVSTTDLLFYTTETGCDTTCAYLETTESPPVQTAVYVPRGELPAGTVPELESGSWVSDFTFVPDAEQKAYCERFGISAEYADGSYDLLHFCFATDLRAATAVRARSYGQSFTVELILLDEGIAQPVHSTEFLIPVPRAWQIDPEQCGCDIGLPYNSKPHYDNFRTRTDPMLIIHYP